MQSGFVAVILTGLVVLGSPGLAISFAGFLLVIATVLLASHRWAVRRWSRKLGPSPTPAAKPPSRPDERFVALSWLIASIGPALFAWFGGGGLVRSPDHVAADFVFGFASVATVGMLCSSLIDWYYTTPRLSGLVSDPPCVGGDDDEWLRVTQVLFVHRWLAAGSVILGLLLSLSALLGSAAYHVALGLLDAHTHSPTSQAIATVIAALLAISVSVVAWVRGLVQVMAGDYVDALKAGTTRGLHPDFAIGQFVAIRLASGEVHEGYILDVALEAITLIPRLRIAGGRRRPIRPQTIWTTQLVTATVSPSSGRYCRQTANECRYLNEKYCVYARRLRTQIAPGP